MNYPDWSIIKVASWGWIAILITILVYELYTAFDGKVATPPLTDLVTRYCPGLIALGVVGWLFVHFLIRYMRNSFWWW